MADNKVRFGLKNVKYALFDAEEKTYGTLKPFPGAVSLSWSREGGEGSDFYADDGVYYTFAGTNGGYSLELEMAHLTDEVRADLLGEIVDDVTGVQFETTKAEPPQFALVYETGGDVTVAGFAFYNCKASRPETNANTKNESPDVDTDTLAIRAAAQEFVINGVTHPVVQSHIRKETETEEQYAAFFDHVVIPGESGESGLSA